MVGKSARDEPLVGEVAFGVRETCEINFEEAGSMRWNDSKLMGYTICRIIPSAIVFDIC